MFVRRGQAALRLGAGLLLAMTCAAAPAVVLAPPAAGDPTPPGECENVQPSASATATEVGGTVEVTGDCFPARSKGQVEIFIQGEPDSQQTKQITTEGGQSVHASFEPKVAGDYQAVIEVGGKTATASFEVLPVEEPTDPPEEDPSDPPEEDPSEPEPTEPSDPPTTDDPTENPTDPTDPPTSGEPTDPTAPPTTDEPTEGSSDAPSTPAPTSPAPGSGDPGAEDQRPPSSSSGADEDENSPAPSAAEKPEPSTGASEPSAASDAGSEKGDGPAATPEHTPEQKRAAALAVLMTSLFAHGVSDGEVGLSPAEVDAELRKLDGDTGEDSASDGGGMTADGSDSEEGADEGENELAATGSDVTVPAALTGLALLGGAGLLWHQRRRRD